MRWSRLTLALVVSLVGAAWVIGQTTNLIEPKFGDNKEPIETGMSRSYLPTVDAGHVGRVLCVGDGKSYLGLYVYDRDGNCVAWDDDVNFVIKDDLAAEWLTAQGGQFNVEVKNFGKAKNPYRFALRSEKRDAKPLDAKGAAPRGAVESLATTAPFARYLKVPSHGEITLKKPFRGGQRACVIAVGDHDPVVHMEIEVVDDKNRVVALKAPPRDASGKDLCWAIWSPPADGIYAVTIRSHGAQYNKCWIVLK